jgi:hypothetical protein
MADKPDIGRAVAAASFELRVEDRLHICGHQLITFNTIRRCCHHEEYLAKHMWGDSLSLHRAGALGRLATRNAPVLGMRISSRLPLLTALTVANHSYPIPGWSTCAEIESEDVIFVHRQGLFFLRAEPFAGPKPDSMMAPRGARRSDQQAHPSRLGQARRFLPSWSCEFNSCYWSRPPTVVSRLRSFDRRQSVTVRAVRPSRLRERPGASPSSPR